MAARLCDLNMLSGHDNFQSYFLIVSISGTYRVVSLRQLRYLESLAETRHFGHAAEACAVSQPALSMQIKELEDELKVSLVERRKSGIEFTEQGEEIAGGLAAFSLRCATCSITPSIRKACCPAS